MARAKEPTREDGPLGWQLWERTDPDSDGWEALLYSDTAITGAPYAADPVAIVPLVLFPTGAEQTPGAHTPPRPVSANAGAGPAAPPATAATGPHRRGDRRRLGPP